ncbi:guanine deaminase [Paenibacillus macquariensis]|uniref:Guanine deaminase n=1 Tax=Paenibacillus macquariensis TaxID=948756 RepID=A0ABY1K2S2_9BACL|nr:guanine deaminase [Paenibacillus macquariensis]MEC0090232.1 guanine deaminase [Paenibacillus macquariensis]OAB39595.1 guanine deaminase [Paenibacillus macquariensis subsp. macquariensis]SIR17801.1 guanine deaminase [Paenibacillus macquariensis]
MTKYTRIFQGTAFSSKSPKEVQILKDYLFCVNTNGMIEQAVTPGDADYRTLLDAYQGKENFHRLAEGQYFLPGFIDLHVHAPQWAQAGTTLDIPLDDWLNTYTFPLESKFADLNFAQDVYQDVVSTLLANGTTTALYFATVHKEASILLAEICAKQGQRGLVGKVVMDHPENNPTYYRDADTQSALADTEEFIIAIKELAKSTKQGVYPVVTPRFIPSCTDEALQGLGALAAKYDTHVQSHCSESDWEHGYVQDRFNKNDAFALHDFGLLRDKSVMAHCNFLNDDDADLFAETGTAVCHCPISNAYFANSVIPIAHLHAKEVEIGLGSDISGGFSPSLFDNARQAVISSRMLEDGVNTALPAEERGVPNSRITINEAFYLATAGGGESLSLPIGRLEANYAWDVQIIDTTLASAKLPIYQANEDLHDVFQKIMYLARPENIREVWVQGEQVHSRML